MSKSRVVFGLLLIGLSAQACFFYCGTAVYAEESKEMPGQTAEKTSPKRESLASRGRAMLKKVYGEDLDRQDAEKRKKAEQLEKQKKEAAKKKESPAAKPTAQEIKKPEAAKGKVISGQLFRMELPAEKTKPSPKPSANPYPQMRASRSAEHEENVKYYKEKLAGIAGLNDTEKAELVSEMEKQFPEGTVFSRIPSFEETKFLTAIAGDTSMTQSDRKQAIKKHFTEKRQKTKTPENKSLGDRLTEQLRNQNAKKSSGS
jgi:hypothetical protein